jgi:hypothetical protein
MSRAMADAALAALALGELSPADLAPDSPETRVRAVTMQCHYVKTPY